jgi:hypothetical protein
VPEACEGGLEAERTTREAGRRIQCGSVKKKRIRKDSFFYPGIHAGLSHWMSKLILHEPAGQNSHFIETTCWEYVLDRIVCRTLGENYKNLPSINI